MPYVVARILKRHFPRRVILTSPSCLALAGCVLSVVSHIIGNPSQEKISPNQLADYLATDYTDIWSLSGQPTETNLLYQLRVMGCTNCLMPVQVRSEVSTLMTGTWQGAFRREILLDNANITPPEKREAVMRLDTLSPQTPPQVHSLYQIWCSSQTLQLQFAEERMRYSKLQQVSDSDLDALRQQQQHLQSQLDLTTHKLEDLTDIERQLSTHKPDGNYSPNTLHGNDKLTMPDNEEGVASSADEIAL